MKYPALDLLRAIAIVWVMLFHSFLVGGWARTAHWLSRYGWMGVDLFFVLSGFLIGNQVLAAAGARRAACRSGDFYLRARVPHPARVLGGAGGVPGCCRRCAKRRGWSRGGSSPRSSLNLSIDYANNAAFSHAWSLCVEEHFYLLFPLLAWLMVRKPSVARNSARCASLLVLGGNRPAQQRSGCTSTALRNGGMQRNWFVEDIYYPTWNRLDGLLAGVVLATLQGVSARQLWERAQAQRQYCAAARGLAVMAAGASGCSSERTGLLGNAIGWPVLSLGLALLVFAGAGQRQRDRRVARAGRGVAGGGFLQPVPGAQGRRSMWSRRTGAMRWRERGCWRSAPTVRPRYPGRRGVALRRGAAVPAPARTHAGVEARSGSTGFRPLTRAQAFRSTWNGENDCVTGMISSRLMLRCGGSVAM